MARARREWVGPRGQLPGSTSPPHGRERSTDTETAIRLPCRSVLFRGTGVGGNDATPTSDDRLLNAENDAYGNESGNDLTPRHLTFIASPGDVLTVKWEQPVHGSTASLNELLSRVDETAASRGPRSLQSS